MSEDASGIIAWLRTWFDDIYANMNHTHTKNEINDFPSIPSANATASNIKMNGAQSAGALSTFAKADHVHPVDTSRVAVSQGTSNSGKFLKVNSSGNVVCETVTPSTYTHPATHPASMITGLAAVATTGSYNDLTNKPSIPEDISELNDETEMLNLDNLTRWSDGSHLEDVAFSGSYNHLVNKPDFNHIRI